MKICHLADIQSIFIQREAEHFANNGDEIDILTYHESPLNFPKASNIKIYPLNYFSKNSHKNSSPSINNPPVSPFNKGGLRWICGKIFQFFYKNTPKSVATLLDLEIYAYRARKIISKINPDIVHGHFLSHYGYIAARTGIKPLIVTAMGDDVLVRPKESLLMKWIMLYASRKANKIRSTAKAISQQLIQYGINEKKIATFPRGVNLNVFRQAKCLKIKESLGWENKKILVMVRNFYSSICGHEYFILALPEVIRKEPEARAVLVGSGQLESKYKKMVAELGLKEYVYFAGETNETGVSDYLNAADIYVATTLSEGTSNALLEAMSCGLPVVVSDASGNLDWVKNSENGFITPRKDLQALAEKLIFLLKDEVLGKKMGEQNFNIAQKRANCEIHFKHLQDIYESLADKNGVNENSSAKNVNVCVG